MSKQAGITIEAVMHDGADYFKITCDCATHIGHGKSALVPFKITAGKVHGWVTLANHPAPMMRKHNASQGVYPVTDQGDQGADTVAVTRTWVKVSGVKAWQASDGRVIVHSSRKRIGRNGWRAAGYELAESVNGRTLGFYAKLTDAKGAE
jgi:hypothetical protein